MRGSMTRFWAFVVIMVIVLSTSAVQHIISRPPLPHTKGGLLLVRYEFRLESGPIWGEPTEVTFVLGTANGGRKRVEFTFPYRKCKYDPKLPPSTFMVKDGKVLDSTPFVTNRDPPGSF